MRLILTARFRAALVLLLVVTAMVHAEIIVAEAERFTLQDKKGWAVTAQDDSYGSHTYGGMWVSQGAGLGAPVAGVGSVATYPITIQAPGKFRVWSKYQAPPYFNFLHKVEIVQNRKTVYSHVYGKSRIDRLWSFSAASDLLWWPWGGDHDTAEAPKDMVDLAAGPAEIRLTTVRGEKPAGDVFVDFIVLTTNAEDNYQGYKPYGVATPFAFEALANTQVYLRFLNTGAAAARLTIARGGHFQPNYGGATASFPNAEVAPGQWSEWFNIGPFCRLVHNEGLWLTLAGATEIPVQAARDAQGKDLVGDMKVVNGEAVLIPIDVTWNRKARVMPSREHAQRVIQLCKTTWRTANNGKKPKELLFFGAFVGKEPWVAELKDALGYNTLLPDKYDHNPCDGYHQHAFNKNDIDAVAKRVPDKSKFRVLSFGDEIGLGEINYTDPQMQAKFRTWLKEKGVTRNDLGVEPDQAVLAKQGTARIAWYSNLFNEEERFAEFRANTEYARQVFGPQVLTGANYSPHHLALFYGPVYQWVDIFKHNGMSMFWAEDYIFSVPEAPQIISWMYAQMHCAVKYNKQPIHFYVMPHAPGQLPRYLRQNMLFSIGAGARHIDSFWVGPEERFTENYVAWNNLDSFKVLHEAIYDSAEAEQYQLNGTMRPARVALVLSKATDFNESRVMVDKANDPFTSQSKNAPARVNQILCRKDQQMLYLALRNTQHAVDLVTEDDIADGILKQYDVVYFAGEWIDTRAVKALDAWVQNGGVLYATAGAGHLNQFNEPEPAMLKLLGLKDNSKVTKNAAIIRTFFELPLMPPIDTITFDGKQIPAIGMRQQLVPDRAQVLGTWKDGSAAVTMNAYGKGKAFTVGTLAGNTYMKTGLRVQPWARGGRKTVYNPVEFDPTTTRLLRLGIDATPLDEQVSCSNLFVEAQVIDNANGTLLTLTNWTNGPVKGLKVMLKMPAKPKDARQVSLQKSIPMTYANGVLMLDVDLEDADYILLPK